MKTYIQIGANKGGDTFFKKMRALTEPSKIVLVEANALLIPALEKNYAGLKDKHTVLIFNNGLVHDPAINTLILHGKHVLSSVLARKSFRHHTGSMQFSPLTFKQLFELADVAEIEELQIDVEGYDYALLESLDLSTILPRVINCEVWKHDCDSTDTIRTGPKYFKEVIQPKMEQFYTLSRTKIGGMPTHLFVLKEPAA